MSQSQSHRKRAPTSSDSLHPSAPAKRATTHSQSKNDIGALQQEFSRLEKEIEAWNNEFNWLVSKAEAAYNRVMFKAYMEHLAKLYDILEKSKPEDTKKQEHEELVSAVQNKIDESKKHIAKEKEAKRLRGLRANAAEDIRRIKANAIGGKLEVIKKLNNTPEGTQAVKDTKARLTTILDRFESKVLDIDKEYPEKTGEVFGRYKEIEDILNKMNIAKVPPTDCFEAIKKAGLRDLPGLLKKMKEKHTNDPRRILLEK